jgi:UDP:flavonoid glycosyltransferase YjiC (YdhE family)
MSRVLAVWEMGANMGHIDRLLVTARALRRRGHAVTFLLRDVSRAHARVAADGFQLGQAPVWLPQMVNPPRLGNYASVLATAGWLDPAGLAALVCAWRTAFDLFKPDLLIADHAPTALLAARGRPWPVWCIGNSFELPPPAAHFPPMAWWDATAAARCADDDARLLQATHQAQALLGDPPLPRLTALFEPAHKALTALPEFNHYGGYPDTVAQPGASYIGDQGVAPVWPAGSGRRAFVYLSPGHADFRAVLAALQAAGWLALVHAAGLSDEAAARLGGPWARFERTPVQTDAAVAAADAVISHASLGLVCAAALAGKPQLVLPSHMEQMMVAQRVAQAGVGLVVAAGSSAVQVGALLHRLVETPTFAAAAQALARRRQGLHPSHSGERLADLVEATLQSG